MTLTTSAALFVSMALLALIPGPGVLTVVARSSNAGFKQGAFAALGILAGDFVFISFALLGLNALSNLMGSFFVIVKYIGAAYLIWMGYNILRTKPEFEAVNTPKNLSSFLVGLFTTLGNPKVILFYISFFPTFLDLAQVTLTDAASIYLVATLSVGGVMLSYAYLAFKAQSLFQSQNTQHYLRYSAGSIFIGSGVYVAIKG